jgi:hypothetical protein
MLRSRHCTRPLLGARSSGHRALNPPHRFRARTPSAVTDARPTPDSGEPPSAFCPRCLRRSDPAAVGALVGLCHCSECSSYACRWCWDGAGGDCPSCGYDFAAAPVVVPPRRLAVLPALPVGRPGLRPSLAAGVLIAALAIFALTLGGGFRPAGGVNGAIDRTTSSPTADSSPSVGGSPSVVTTATRTDGPAATPHGQQVAATDGPTTPGVTPTPAEEATPEQPEQTTSPTQQPTQRPPPTTPPTTPPTPEPTAAPTPTPTPTPTPDPTPTCKTVPDLIGMTVGNSRSAWSAAGFTGQFSPKAGQSGKIVTSQSQVAGDCLPATTTMSVRT